METELRVSDVSLQSLVPLADLAVALARRDRPAPVSKSLGVLLELSNDGRISWAGGEAESLTGWKAPLLVGMSLDVLLGAEDRARFTALVAASSAVGAGHTRLSLGVLRVPCELCWWAPDGAPGEGALRMMVRRARADA